MSPHILSSWLERPTAWFLCIFLVRVFIDGYWRTKENERALESAFKASYLLISWCFGQFVSWGMLWRDGVDNIDLCWLNGGTIHSGEQLLLQYYAMQIGYYSYALCAQICLDEHRKDFWIMIIHHIITLILIIGSYTQSHMCIGVVILLCFDVADILLEAGKTMKCLKWERATKLMFIGFCATWTYWRLYYYPFHVLYSIMYGREKHSLYVQYFGIYQVILFLLFAIQIRWTKDIVIIAWRVVTTGHLKDSREYNGKIDVAADSPESKKDE